MRTDDETDHAEDVAEPRPRRARHVGRRHLQCPACARPMRTTDVNWVRRCEWGHLGKLVRLCGGMSVRQVSRDWVVAKAVEQRVFP